MKLLKTTYQAKSQLEQTARTTRVELSTTRMAMVLVDLPMKTIVASMKYITSKLLSKTLNSKI